VTISNDIRLRYKLKTSLEAIYPTVEFICDQRTRLVKQKYKNIFIFLFVSIVSFNLNIKYYINSYLLYQLSLYRLNNLSNA
jgi:hypothetical protein